LLQILRETPAYGHSVKQFFYSQGGHGLTCETTTTIAYIHTGVVRYFFNP